MTKVRFLLSLHDRLSGLPQDDVEERLSFYSEMIEDRIEEGVSEEQAVAELGSVDEVAAQIVADIPLSKIARAKIKPKRRMKAWEIMLLVLGSPVWLSLLIAAAAVLFALYVVIWAVVVSLWAVFVSLAAAAAIGVPVCIVFALSGRGAAGLAMLGAGIVCAGLAIFLFYGCLAAGKGTLLLTKKIVRGTKNSMIKREDAA